MYKSNKFHPYHIQLNQELNEADFERRLTFSQWVLGEINDNEYFFKFVLFTDESTFHKSGFVNRHNFYYYDNRNPHTVSVNNYQHKWSINLWGGIIHDFVIGPYFIEGCVTGTVFLEFLRHDFLRLTDHLPEYIKNRMSLQLDGAPPHSSMDVQQHLNEHFAERWIGRGGV